MLDQTPTEIKEREALLVNPAKTCQPIGAMYAALGIHNCLPHSHGSQGCCAYHRSHLTRHYKEPVMAATSSFTEGASVFGGGANLSQAINNIFTVYKPDVIAVNTTCLSETIGDDLNQIIKDADQKGLIPEGKVVFHANTPSYQGSHVTGFSNMCAAMAKRFAESTGEMTDQINIFPGYVEPSDMREYKRIASVLGVKTVVFPDTSGVLDTPQNGKHEFYPKGGATIEQMASAGDSIATIGLGKWSSEAASIALDNKCSVPYEVLDLPIGISATDRFVSALADLGGAFVPEELEDERGRLLDAMIDTNQYLYQKKVAIVSDPDHAIALTEFVIDLGMIPTYVITGTPGNAFETRIKELCAEVNPDVYVKAKGDWMLVHQLIKNGPVDLLLGNTYGKYVARAEDVPLVRVGFPILDRIGHSYFPIVGYMGGLRLVEKIVTAFQDRLDRDNPEETFELVM
jgi:nitrogenase molybdenum-iron protein beta chain